MRGSYDLPKGVLLGKGGRLPEIRHSSADPQLQCIVEAYSSITLPSSFSLCPLVTFHEMAQPLCATVSIGERFVDWIAGRIPVANG
jgi:hypothetical protein